MAKRYGISANEIIPQSDFKAVQNENGGWMATQSFIIQKTGIDNTIITNKFASGVSLTTLDPNADEYFGFLKLIGIPDVSTVEGGWTRVGVQFTGFYTASYNQAEEEVESLPTYYLRGAVMESPLAEHPKFKALDEAMKISLGRLMEGSVIYKNDGAFGSGLYWNSETGSYLPASEQITAESGDAYEFATRIQQGKNTYKVGTFEWTKRWEASAGLSSAALAKLGKIATPPGNPPEPAGDRDWLLISANQEQSGSGEYRFQKELVFLLSDEGGHDSFLQDT